MPTPLDLTSSTLAADAPQPVLRTERLVLRPFASRDAADVQRLAGAFEVADTTMHIPHPYPDGLAEQWMAKHAPAWEARTIASFAIADGDTDALRGAVALALSMAHCRGELGYWVGAPFWNRGYCTEAARALVAFGFDVLGLNRVQARHLTRNPASGRVMQKLGMTLEGVSRDAYMKGDHFEDVAMYAVLRSEWKERT